MATKNKNNILASKIKKIMQSDEDVGKIAQLTPVVIAHAMELFLERLAKGASEIALARVDKVLQPAHLKEFVNNEPSMDFLKAIVEKAPELQDKKLQVKRKEKAEGEAGASKRKSKSEKDAGESKPAPKKRKKEATVPKEEAGIKGNAPESIKLEPTAAEPNVSEPVKEEALKGHAVGKFQRTWQTTGERSSAPAPRPRLPAPGEGALPPSPLMAVLTSAAAAPTAVVEEDDYDAE